MSERFAPDMREVPGLGMVTLRGTLAAPEFAGAVRDALGLAVPDPRGITGDDAGALAWMSPDEALLICPAAEVAARIAGLEAALAGQFASVVDVSDARAMFEVAGPGAREVLAKLTPMDLHPDRFGPGEMRRTRLAQVPAALWMPEPDRIRLICFRSVEVYVSDLLRLSAAPGGAVRVFAD
jgi:sarcosine oxidase subunit gamma